MTLSTTQTRNGHQIGARNLLIKLAPQVRLVPYNHSVNSPVCTATYDKVSGRISKSAEVERERVLSFDENRRIGLAGAVTIK